MDMFRFDNPDEYVNGIPHDLLSQLRRQAPFEWHESVDKETRGFWLVLRHQDVIDISKRPELFDTSSPLIRDPAPRALWAMYPSLAMIANNLMTFDHPIHSAFKCSGNALFAKRVAESEPKIRFTCRQMLNDIMMRPRIDFAVDVALSISVRVVLGEFLGIPRQDLQNLTNWILTINAMDDPVFRPTNEALIDAAEAVLLYGRQLLTSLMRCRSDSFLSDLVNTTNTEGISPDQLLSAYWFPVAAGAFDTTASTIAGGVYALLRFPSQLARLMADQQDMMLAVNEMLRWVSPVIYFSRTATRDTLLRGRTIRKGQKIVLCYASANRDEAVFVNPDVFDVKRVPNEHVAFGYGSHFCLGSRLALLTLRIVFEEVLPYLTKMEISGSVRYTRSSWMNRIRQMPVVISERGNCAS
jgi:cytochrome P450